jgi:hypothetical protein
LREYGIEGLTKIRELINSEELKEKGRTQASDFTRERKMGFQKLINYIMQKKGITSSMEIKKYFDECGETEEICKQSLLDQRKKLNPIVFKELGKEYLKGFYSGEHESEIKT